MRVSKEFKVGLLVVLGLLLLFIGTNFLKGGGIFGKDREFFAEFENSAGLQPSNEVQLNGVRVGQVMAVDLKEDDASKVVVRFTIEKEELLIPNSSEIWLISSDILGTKALDLRIPNDTVPRANVAYYESGDYMTAKTEMSYEDKINEEILPLKKKTEELIASVEGIIVSVNAFWDTSAAYTIDESLYEVRDAIDKFGELANNLSILVANETQQVNVILKDVKTITSNLAANSDSITNIVNNLSSITSDVANSDLDTILYDTKEGLKELNSLLADINSGEGTVGKLLHTDSLHNELLQTNQSVQNLLDDFTANPNKFVHFSIFGRKVKGYQTTPERRNMLDEVLDSLQKGSEIQYKP
ncbi:MAG: MlaD family protein [Crocinitomicaceae bacterium]|nr:MCE family protein [Crocinitomicaceae bacterium]